MATKTLNANRRDDSSGNNLEMGPRKDDKCLGNRMDDDKEQDTDTFSDEGQVEEEPGNLHLIDIEDADAEVISSDGSDKDDTSFLLVEEESITTQAVQQDLQSIEINENTEEQIDNQDIELLDRIDEEHKDDKSQPDSIQETQIEQPETNVKGSGNNIPHPNISTVQQETQTNGYNKELLVTAKQQRTESVDKVPDQQQQQYLFQNEHKEPSPHQSQNISNTKVLSSSSKPQETERVATSNIQEPSQEQQQMQSGHKIPVQVEQRDKQPAAGSSTGFSEEQPVQQVQQQESQQMEFKCQPNVKDSELAQSEEQEPLPQCKEEKNKKKKRSPMKKLMRKVSKSKAYKKSKSFLSSSEERTKDGKEPIASVDIAFPCSPMGPSDDDSGVAKVHFSRTGSESPSYQDSLSGSSRGLRGASLQDTQQISANERKGTSAQVASEGAKVSFKKQVLVQEQVAECVAETTAVIPKRPAPPLDKSSQIEVNYKPPSRYTSKCSPTEQFYDVLMLHSTKPKDWEEVDYVKKLGKRYAWKMISVEEFPAGMTKFQIFSTMLPRCTYTMLLLTKDFFDDVWCNHRYSACLTAAVVNRTEHWSVIPVLYQDSGYETPLELITIAGLQREARYFRKNLKSTVCSAMRKEREEALGFPHQPTPPSSPDSTPPMTRKTSTPAVHPHEIKEDTSGMSSGEVYRLLKPELAPNDMTAQFFSDSDRYRRVCQLLDMEQSLGRDYRLLAQMMGFGWAETRSLGQEMSPTAKILEVFCLQRKGKPKIEVLRDLLEMVDELDHEEVKGLIENEIKVARFTSCKKPSF